MPGKKKRIRQMRTGRRKNPDGTYSTHMMGWLGDPTRKRGNFAVYPTIAPKKGKTSERPEDWKEQTPEEAKAAGEMIEVKSRRRAERLAAGSWKKGIDKREAMKNYRKNKD